MVTVSIGFDWKWSIPAGRQNQGPGRDDTSQRDFMRLPFDFKLHQSTQYDYRLITHKINARMRNLPVFVRSGELGFAAI
jgi:hypothetical protein